MRDSIFKENQQQAQFEKDGFVKIPLLENHQIEQLQELCVSYFPEVSGVFFSSSYLNDASLKKKISKEIIEIIQDKLAKFFINYRSIGAAFLIKGVGAQSEMPMHQDWTIVDESKFYAANIWIPLTPTDAKNGTIEVMKGSHRWNNALRAPTLPFPFEGHQERIKKELTLIETKPGEVVVLNQALIHYSKPNLSDAIRPAITTGIVSKSAPLVFHYWNKEEKDLEKFEQADDFLLEFTDFHQAIFQRPLQGKSLGSIDYQIPKIDESELEDYLKSSTKKSSFFNRIFSR